MSNIGVYGVLCTANGKWYVGQTKNLHNRRISHLTALATGKHPRAEMLSDAIRYGADCFEFHVLSETHPDNLFREEREWIARKNSANPECGYNIHEGYEKSKPHVPITNAANRRGRHFFHGTPILVDFDAFEKSLRYIA